MLTVLLAITTLGLLGLALFSARPEPVRIPAPIKRDYHRHPRLERY